MVNIALAAPELFQHPTFPGSKRALTLRPFSTLGNRSKWKINSAGRNLPRISCSSELPLRRKREKNFHEPAETIRSAPCIRRLCKYLYYKVGCQSAPSLLDHELVIHRTIIYNHFYYVAYRKKLPIGINCDKVYNVRRSACWLLTDYRLSFQILRNLIFTAREEKVTFL